MLTDRGTEFCGTQSHEYELYLAVEDIDHSRTKTKSLLAAGIAGFSTIRYPLRKGELQAGSQPRQ